MKFLQVSKRIGLFLAVNFLVVLTISLILWLFHVPTRIGRYDFSGLMILCLVWGMGGAFISLALSRVFAKMFHGVQVIDPRTDDPNLRELVNIVHGLAQRAGLPEMPEVGIYVSPEVNAFATGPSRSRALVAVSTGLLNTMNREQIEGVLGHELAHVANGDMVTMTLIQGIINAFVMFLARILAFFIAQGSRSRDDSRGGGNFFMQYMLTMLFQFVFSLLGMIVVMWFSRWREFRADAGGARYAGRQNMIGALRALQRFHEQAATEGATPSFQTLKINAPPSGILRLFMSHPPLEERIARLEQMRDF